MPWDPNAPGSTAQQDDEPPPTPTPVTVTSTGLTDAQLRAAPVPVSSSSAVNASVPTGLSVGTTATMLLAARAERRALLIQNVHAVNDLYLGLGAAPTIANGIKVKPGDSFADEVYTGVIHGIASAAGTDVRVVEVY